jgi:asparagine synthase (glutamine-hydrolysing)
MSAIAGVFDPDARVGGAALRTMLAGMAGRGTDVVDIWHDECAALATGRAAWEADAAIASDDRFVVAADAALYYRDDLRRALPRTHPRGADATAAQLILAAFRAWGEEALHRLEGDFAFVLYDRADRSVLCARDFAGKRPLHYAESGAALVVASTIGGVRAHHAVSDELDLVAIAETAAALFAASHQTAFRRIRALPAGSILAWQGAGARTRRFWRLPLIDAGRASSFENGARELRELLVAAVAQRLDEAAPTSVWLSGGWDSPAVFAAGEEHARRSGTPPLQPVSISYPPDDPGREDELIESILAPRRRATRWIDVADIPFLMEPEAEAARREEPFVHPFEHWNRALARGSRAVGTRVALDGNGGDMLFAGPLLYLADLFRTGRLLALRAEWRGKGLAGRGPRTFFDLAIQPALPDWARAIGRRLRPARAWNSPWEPWLPDWIEPDFERRHGLRERARQHAPMPSATSLADAQLEIFLTHPTGPRLISAYTALALEEGVEVRSPLLDERIVRFATARPVSERTRGNETKRLLRAACRGWLPDAFLDPRPRRTGNSGGYAGREFRQRHAERVSRAFENPVLAQLGIVDCNMLQKRWSEYRRGNSRHELPLFLTYQAELWLRTRQESSGPVARQPASLACA